MKLHTIHTIDGKSFVQVNFGLTNVEPDTTNYKQRKPTFFPQGQVFVAVNVPIDKENLANHTQWTEYLIDNGNKSMPDLVLTPVGFEYAMQQLAPISTKSESSKTEDWDTDDTNWDSGTTEPSSEEETEKVVEKATAKSTATSWDDFEEEAESSSTAREEKANFEDNTEWES